MSATGDAVIHMMNGDSEDEAIRKVQEERLGRRLQNALNAEAESVLKAQEELLGQRMQRALNAEAEAAKATFTERRLKALDSLREELARLPDFSAFGDSNASEKAEMRRWIADLGIEAYNADAYHNPDVIAYLKGEWSPINDSI